MRSKPSVSLLLLAWTLTSALAAQTVEVHFIHGSKPRPAFRHSEKKWRGGLWGGHVGLGLDSVCVVDFFPKKKVHAVAHRRRPEGQFALRTEQSFWRYFGLPPDSLQRTTLRIPVSAGQYGRLDSLTREYASRSPYDYAFFGMRCTSASCMLLMEADILKKRSRGCTVLRYFYPKKLRKRLLYEARERGWEVLQTKGCWRRKWEGGNDK